MTAEAATRLRTRLASLSEQQRGALARALVATSDSPARPLLVAYISPVDETPEPDDITQFLKERFPDHMIPVRYIFVDCLPRTAAGKLDRKALADPIEVTPTRDGEPIVAPRTEAERILSRIWKAALGTDEINIHDDFFELGGDSILSIRVIARANEAGLNITPQQFFASPTVADLAALVEEPAD